VPVVHPVRRLFDGGLAEHQLIVRSSAPFI
jgi:hypothetical protein